MTEEKYEKVCRDIIQYEEKIHEKNQKRIKVGIKCLFFIPLVFLALLMITHSEKSIFLILWILSLFIIATYLIYVEYLDFEVQRKMQTLNEDVNGEINYLIGNDVEELEASIKDVYKQLEELKEKRKETVSRKIEERKEQLLIKKEQLLDNIEEKKEGGENHEEHSEDNTK